MLHTPAPKFERLAHFGVTPCRSVCVATLRGRMAVVSLVGIYLMASGALSRAQSQVAATVTSHRGTATDPDFFMNRGRLTTGLQLGYAVENAIPRNISHINMLIAQPQVGLIVYDARSSKALLRRFEILGEGILGGAVHPGGHMLGGTLLFRFNLRPLGRTVPFLDVGSGPLHITTDLRAPELSGHFQFMSQGGGGIQYFFRPQRAFVIEYRYLHMSNAGITSPNPGFNASMVTIGFRWLRRPLGGSATP